MPAKKINDPREMLLWNEFLNGDTEAYKLIYDTYVDELFRFGYYYSRDRELTKDCIQDVFVKLFTARPRLDNPGSIKNYIFTALRHSIYNARKRDKALTISVEEGQPHMEAHDSPEDPILKSEEVRDGKAKFDRMLTSLTPRQVEAIYYRYVDNLSIREIGDIMGMNYQSVQNLLQRSLKKAKNHL